MKNRCESWCFSYYKHIIDIYCGRITLSCASHLQKSIFSGGATVAAGGTHVSAMSTFVMTSLAYSWVCHGNNGTFWTEEKLTLKLSPEPSWSKINFVDKLIKPRANCRRRVSVACSNYVTLSFPNIVFRLQTFSFNCDRGHVISNFAEVCHLYGIDFNCNVMKVNKTALVHKYVSNTWYPIKWKERLEQSRSHFEQASRRS